MRQFKNHSTLRTAAPKRPTSPSSIYVSRREHNNHTNNNIDSGLSRSRLCYGDFVALSDGRQGTIRYIGTLSPKRKEIVYGVSLNYSNGNHNGTFKNVTYWRDRQKHGIFVESFQIKSIIKGW